MTIRPLLLSTALIAACALPTTTAAAAAQNEGDYCVANISTGQIWCATTESGLDSLLAGGAMGLDSSYLLMDLYEHANKTGAYLALYGSSPCDDSGDLDGSYTLPSNWNDRISSFQGHNKCDTKLYEHGNYTGLTYGPTYSTNWVGSAMNDKASSLRVY
jgi:hypothetical protein